MSPHVNIKIIDYFFVFSSFETVLFGHNWSDIRFMFFCESCPGCFLVYKSDLSKGHVKLGHIDWNNDAFSH